MRHAPPTTGTLQDFGDRWITGGPNRDFDFHPAPGSGTRPGRAYDEAEQAVREGLRNPKNLGELLNNINAVLGHPTAARGKRAELERLRDLVEAKLEELRRQEEARRRQREERETEEREQEDNGPNGEEDNNSGNSGSDSHSTRNPLAD